MSDDKNLPNNEQALLAAIGHMFGEERSRLDKALAPIQARLDSGDQNLILKGAASAILNSTVAAIRSHCETITLKKSIRTSGPLVKSMTGLVD